MQKVYDYCSSEKCVLPTVYEGHYSPVSRHVETELLPLLRKWNISFNAYGALAGGFLTKSPEFFTNSAAGTRWDKSTGVGKLYHSLYNKPSFIKALAVWEKISKVSGLSQADLAYRWVAYNSKLTVEHGDGILLGARSPEQLQLTLDGLKDGPLGKTVAQRIDEVWESVKDETIMENFNREKRA